MSDTIRYTRLDLSSLTVRFNAQNITQQSFIGTLCWILSFKVKLSRYMPCRRLGGKKVWLLLILDLGSRWGCVVSVTPRPRFAPGEKTHDTHWTGSWVDPRAGLDTGARRKILCPCRGSNPGGYCPLSEVYLIYTTFRELALLQQNGDWLSLYWHFFLFLFIFGVFPWIHSFPQPKDMIFLLQRSRSIHSSFFSSLIFILSLISSFHVLTDTFFYDQ
jgi:hypothetical protein